jgi:hypothetical protein
VAEQPGTVTLSANVELVGLEQSFELVVVE